MVCAAACGLYLACMFVCIGRTPRPATEGLALATKKRLLAIVFALFAAAFALMPACAFADNVTVITADMLDENGAYTIESGGNYQLADGLTTCKAITVKTGSSVDLDLNGCTITADNAGCVTARNYAELTLHDGTLVQTNTSHTAVRIENGSEVSLDNVTASTVNHACIDVEAGTANILSGTYAVTNSSDSNNAVVHCNYGYANISGGTFTNNNGYYVTGVTDLDKSDHITISGGTFSFPPTAGANLEGIGILYNASTNSFYAAAEADVLSEAKYCVSSDHYVNVFFADESSANNFKYFANGTLCPISVQVTFDADNGSDATTSTILYGAKVTKPVPSPIKADNKFLYWTLDGAEYDFSKAATSDITLVAAWQSQSPVCKIGETTYTSLQDAINYVQDGQTIVLTENVTECATANAGSFTIDLNGKTLTNDKKGKDVLTISGSANVNLISGVAGGAVKAVAADDAIQLKDTCALTIDEGVTVAADVDSNDAVCMKGGSLTVNGATISADDYCAIYAEGGSLNITGGTFGSSSAADKPALVAWLYSGNSLSITGGDFYGEVYVAPASKDASAAISGGTYDPDNDIYVARVLEDGKALLRNEQNRIEVVDASEAKARASKVVRLTYRGVAYALYFEDETAAEECYNEFKDQFTDVSIHSIYHVTFETNGTTVDTLYVEEGDALGELPEAGSVDGYDFVGWYVDGKYADENKVTAETVPTSDLTVKSMWLAKGSDEGGEPTDEPSDKGGKSDDKGSDKVMPQTGDVVSMAAGVAAAGAALAGVGALRRRK